MTKDGLLQGFAHFCSFCLENSDVKQRFMYQNRPSKLHQLPFDQGLDGSPLNQSSYRFRSNMRRELIVTLQVQGFQDLRQVYQNRSELESVQDFLIKLDMKPYGNKHFFTKLCNCQTYEQPPRTSQNSYFQSHFSVLKIGRIFPKKNL